MSNTRLKLGAVGAAAVLAAGAGAAIATGGNTQTDTQKTRAALDGSKPKNVILLIGDGMGVSEVTAARYYQYGAAGRMNFDRLPFTGFQNTWSVKPGPGNVPDYSPDSASTATSWASGIKTIDERVGQGPSEALEVPGKNVRTVLENAQLSGKKVGNVSTAEITDATPAAQVSHISQRGCQGPEDAAKLCAKETKAAGGPGSIAEQMVDHRVDVTLGGGAKRFAQTDPARDTKPIDTAKKRNFNVVSNTAELNEITEASRWKPVLGLFSEGNMTTEWDGPRATRGDGTPAQKCETGKRPAEQPSLTAMTNKAISLLQGGRRGFFLQVEGASIDKQDHASNACAQIGETVEFDKAVGAALDYQRKNPDTLVVVTADHSHTSQIVAEDSDGEDAPTGYSNNLTTKDGQTMRVTYGTAGGANPPADAPSQQHTGAAVPVFASGPGAAGVLGTNDHPDLFGLTQGK